MKATESEIIRRLALCHASVIGSFERWTGIHPGRWRILAVLSQATEVHQSVLARETVLDPATITRILKDFERDGLIVRRTSAADSRLVLISLTERGKRFTSKTSAKRARFIERLLDGFDPAEIAQTEAVLARIENAARNVHLDIE